MSAHTGEASPRDYALEASEPHHASFDILPTARTETGDLIDLAARRLGGGVVLANDEFFAPKERLLNPEPAVWDEHLFTERGKWMDGWETRRRRESGHDWAIVRLGVPGVVRAIVVDTSHFKGNFPESCSVEACALEGYPSPDELASPARSWVELVPRSALLGDDTIRFEVEEPRRFTHVRLSIYPDGGVARLRVLGEAVPDPRRLVGMPIDLAALEHGGLVVACSDMFYSSRHNLNTPGPATHMGDGWETKRRRGSGNDWSIIRLAAPGQVRQILLDTTHFKGNAPGAAQLVACDARVTSLDDPSAWWSLLGRHELQPDTQHWFSAEASRSATHVRLDVYPDGGLGRLRLFGTLDATGGEHLALRWLDRVPGHQARSVIQEAGADAAWADAIVEARPIGTWARLEDLAASVLQRLPPASRPDPGALRSRLEQILSV